MFLMSHHQELFLTLTTLDYHYLGLSLINVVIKQGQMSYYYGHTLTLKMDHLLEYFHQQLLQGLGLCLL